VLDGLEQPAPVPRQPGEDDDDADPPDRFDDPEAEAPAPPRRAPGRAEARDHDTSDRDAPRDGRQLLGWASKQVPDLKGILIGYGKKRGLHSKIVEWSPQQVAEAYRFARGKQS